jgi:UDP-MurNAc hydroxylase
LAFGPFDVHFLQYSGAIWWPWTYELPLAAKRAFGAAKRANGLDRAARYARAIGARHIVPSAGPACFLDEELFALNDVGGDDANTFPDQTVFLCYLAERGIGGGMLLVPGAALEVDGGYCRVHWPTDRGEALRPFTGKAEVPAQLRRSDAATDRGRQAPVASAGDGRARRAQELV